MPREPSMSCFALLSLSVLLLCLPSLLLPPRPRQPFQPEIHGTLRPMHWLVIAYCALWHRLKTNGWAPLPERGPAILIANHTCGIDHLVLQAGCQRVLGFIIAREYYDWSLIHWFCKRVGCIPVNRDGRDIHATRGCAPGPQGRPGAADLSGRADHAKLRARARSDPSGRGLPGDSLGRARDPGLHSRHPGNQPDRTLLATPSRSVVIFGDPIDLSDFEPAQAGNKDVQAEVSRRFFQALVDLRHRSWNLPVRPVGSSGETASLS